MSSFSVHNIGGAVSGVPDEYVSNVNGGVSVNGSRNKITVVNDFSKGISTSTVNGVTKISNLQKKSLPETTPYRDATNTVRTVDSGKNYNNDMLGRNTIVVGPGQIYNSGNGNVCSVTNSGLPEQNYFGNRNKIVVGPGQIYNVGNGSVCVTSNTLKNKDGTTYEVKTKNLGGNNIVTTTISGNFGSVKFDGQLSSETSSYLESFVGKKSNVTQFNELDISLEDNHFAEAGVQLTCSITHKICNRPVRIGDYLIDYDSLFTLPRQEDFAIHPVTGQRINLSLISPARDIMKYIQSLILDAC
jgi:hypothetical protein